MIVKVNLSKKENYYTQRNNVLYPFSSCFVTSMINALWASGVDFPITPGEQPEDSLTKILDSQEAWDLAKLREPSLIKLGYPPRQIHSIVMWGVNKFVGYCVDTFLENSSMQYILHNLWVGKNACVMDGKFTKDGHVVCVVGLTYEHSRGLNWLPRTYSDIELDRVRSIIIDDSYGNYFTDYKDTKGDDIEFDLKTFNELSNTRGNLNNKRVHILRRMV